MTETFQLVEHAIRDIMVAELDVPPAALDGSDSSTPLLGRGVGLDSVEAMALATALESRFGIEIADSELTIDLFSRFGNLVELVARKMSGKESG